MKPHIEKKPTKFEIDQLIKLHNETMNKESSEEEFKEKYLYNFLGFSFHGLMKLEDIIVGCSPTSPTDLGKCVHNLVLTVSRSLPRASRASSLVRGAYAERGL